MPLATPSPQSRASRPSYEYNEPDNLALPTTATSPRTSADRLSEREQRRERDSVRISSDSRRDGSLSPKDSPRLFDGDRFTTHAPTPSQFRTARGDDKIAITGDDDRPRIPVFPSPPGRDSAIIPPAGMAPGAYAEGDSAQRGPILPPPLPPKTPIPGQERRNNRESRDGEGRRLRKQPNMAGPGAMAPPYPLDDAPPVVNMARKPEGWGR